MVKSSQLCHRPSPSKTGRPGTAATAIKVGRESIDTAAVAAAELGMSSPGTAGKNSRTLAAGAMAAAKPDLKEIVPEASPKLLATSTPDTGGCLASCLRFTSSLTSELRSTISDSGRGGRVVNAVVVRCVDVVVLLLRCVVDVVVGLTVVDVVVGLTVVDVDAVVVTGATTRLLLDVVLVV